MPNDLPELFDAEGNTVDLDDLLPSNSTFAEKRKLEKQVREQSEQISELLTAGRKVAFYEAGVNPTDERDGYFIRGYDGPLESDAIKSAYELFSGTAPDTSQATRVAQAASGAVNVPAGAASGLQPFQSDPEGYHAALQGAAGSQDKILGVMREWGSPVADVDD